MTKTLLSAFLTIFRANLGPKNGQKQRPWKKVTLTKRVKNRLLSKFQELNLIFASRVQALQKRH